MPTTLENLDTWMKIESHVHEVYPHFLSNLTARHGSLTEHQIKICMLTLLKRNANEIAEIMQFKEVHAVHEATSRLREKFGVCEGPLVVYLLNLARIPGTNLPLHT